MAIYLGAITLSKREFDRLTPSQSRELFQRVNNLRREEFEAQSKVDQAKLEAVTAAVNNVADITAKGIRVQQDFMQSMARAMAG